MDNSILTTLATIHSAILSIVLAATVAFFLYSYEKIQGLQETLNDSRYQVSRLMWMGNLFRTSGIDYFDYVGDEGPDLERIRNELLLLSGTRFSEPDENIQSLEELSQEEGDERVLDLLVLLSEVDPYSDRLTLNENGQGSNVGEPQRKKYSLEWKNQLTSLTPILLIMRTPLLERIARFEASTLQDQASPAQNIERLRRLGFYTGPQQMATDFFQRVERVQQDFIPTIVDRSYKLGFWEDFKIKRVVTGVALFSLFILVMGISVPLYMHFYLNSPYIERIQIGLLIVTMAPYAGIILYALAAVLKLPIP